MILCGTLTRTSVGFAQGPCHAVQYSQAYSLGYLALPGPSMTSVFMLLEYASPSLNCSFKGPRSDCITEIKGEVMFGYISYSGCKNSTEYL
jgi:hypothetical protein